ncbi:MAG TPA: ABC transporter permease [Candidatus Hydrogenedentes bacterium]|nr:ABC transporter permease [Candidatus Hydrogenedentota bacterium]HRK35298.1 ABC transporter permease [Candidatus Hydrogenedentota bacterium]
MRKLLRRETALLLVLIGLFAVFSFSVDGFFNWINILDRARYWVVPGMIAVAMTFIIATAGIDLSVGSILALSGIALGLLFRDGQWPIALAIGGAIFTGTAAGAFNGFAIGFLRIPPLVVTLATMALFRGIAMGLSQGKQFGGYPDGFEWISQGDLLTLRGPASVSIPTPILALVIVVLAGSLLLRRTWIGRFTELLGENPVAARFAAIDVRWLTFGLYTACGAVCGVAALFHTALYASAKADTAMGMELEAIACVVVGGTRISGGKGSVLGTLLGLLIIGILRYGLEMAGVKSVYVVILVGILLVTTAVFNEWAAARESQ